MLPKGYRNPASPSSYELFSQFMVGRLILSSTALIGFLLPAVIAGQMLHALKGAWEYIVIAAIVWFGFGLLQVAFWSKLIGEVGMPSWATGHDLRVGRKRHLAINAGLGLSIGAILGFWYLHAQS